MSDDRITIDDDGAVWSARDGESVALGCFTPHRSQLGESAIEALRAAVAPGPDPAPKVGDRVRHLHGAEGEVLDVRPRDPLVQVGASLLTVVASAPAGVSETEGDRPAPRRRVPRAGECCSCGKPAVVVFLTDEHGEVPSCRL